MNQKFVIFTVALVLLVVAIAVDGKKDKEMKDGKHKHGCPMRACMKPELVNATDSPIKTLVSSSVMSCMNQMGISFNMSSEGEKKDKHTKHGKHGEGWKKMNPCLPACTLRKIGVLSADNTTMNTTLIEKLVAENLRPEVQTSFMDKMKECLTKKNTSLDKVVLKEDCSGVKVYMKCMRKAAKKTCLRDAMDSNTTDAPADKDDEDSDEEENDEP